MEQKAKMNFNDEQKKAIESEKPLVLISAGAGSGKTRVLTERFLYLCNKKLSEIINGEKNPIAAEVKQIVAITFTEKAAREMKKRIRERIAEELMETQTWEEGPKKLKTQSFWKEQREALDSGFITTFHSFCHKILHQFALKANLSPSFIVIDEVQSKLIKNEVFTEMFAHKANHKKWKPLYNYYTKQQLKASVNGVYAQVQENPEYDVLGFKERFNPRELINGQLEQINLKKLDLLEDFCKRARECVLSFPPESSVKGKLKEKIPTIVGYVNSFKIDEVNPDKTFNGMKDIFSGVHHTWRNSAPSVHELCKEHYGDLALQWENYKALPVERLDDFCEIIDLFMDLLCTFTISYQQRKDERTALDFGDLQKKAIGLLKDDEDVRRWCQREFKHFMVDEFQDTNGLQMGMLQFIKPQYQFIVGDGKQSIYKFRGADVTLMNTLEEQLFGDLGADYIDMGKNYRNCDSIIQFVNELFTGLLVKAKKSLSFGIDYKPLISNRTQEFEKYPHKRVELLTLEKTELEEDTEDPETKITFFSEFEMLSERILEIVNQGEKLVKTGESWRGAQWRDFAILMPTRTGLPSLEKVLNDKNIPYVVHGGVGFFQKQEIKDMLNLLRFINRPWENVYISALLRGPLFRLNLEELFTIRKLMEVEDSFAQYILKGKFRDDPNLSLELKRKLTKFYELYLKYVPLIPQKSFSSLLIDIFEKSGLKTALLIQTNPLQKVKNVEKLMEIMASQRVQSLEELLEQVDIIASLSDREGEAEAEIPEGNMVNIMTVHASKGLEFPIVCLPKLNTKIKETSEYFIYDQETYLAAKFKEENKENPFKVDEYLTPSFNMVKSKAEVAALEESKRLFYVATTRARDYLLMTATVNVKKGESGEKETIVDNSWLHMVKNELTKNPLLDQYLLIKKHSDIQIQGIAQNQADTFNVNLDTPPIELPFTFSVSEILLFMNSPVKYYDNYVLKLKPEWFKEDKHSTTGDRTIAGTEFGTLVHRACELFDQGFTEEEAVDEALLSVEEGEGIVNQKIRKEILALLEKYKEVSSLEIGEHVASEWNFATNISGAYIVGEIDKIFKTKKGFHLMDLKTNISTNLESLIEVYMPQVYLYKMAYEKEENSLVNQVSLFFMRKGKEGLITISPESDYESKIEEVIKQMVGLKRKNATRNEYLALEAKI